MQLNVPLDSPASNPRSEFCWTMQLIRIKRKLCSLCASLACVIQLPWSAIVCASLGTIEPNFKLTTLLELVYAIM